MFMMAPMADNRFPDGDGGSVSETFVAPVAVSCNCRPHQGLGAWRDNSESADTRSVQVLRSRSGPDVVSGLDNTEFECFIQGVVMPAVGRVKSATRFPPRTGVLLATSKRADE